MKTFTIVGTSTLGRMTKTRVANGSIKARSAVLARNGHTLINFIELPEAMSKLDAINFFEAQTELTPKFEDVSADILAREVENDAVGIDEMIDFNDKASSIHY